MFGFSSPTKVYFEVREITLLQVNPSVCLVATIEIQEAQF